MAITINGSGITSSEIASNTITSGNLADGTITNADINASAAIVGSKLSGAGKVLQVVTSADISLQVTSTSTTFADTGVTATITPTSTSSKVFAVASGSCNIKGTSYNANAEHRILRDSTEITATETGYDYWAGVGAPSHGFLSTSTVLLSSLDSPATSSAVTYKIQHRVRSTSYSGSTSFPAENSASIKKGCRITLMEVAG